MKNLLEQQRNSPDRLLVNQWTFQDQIFTKNLKGCILLNLVKIFVLGGCSSPWRPVAANFLLQHSSVYLEAPRRRLYE